MSTCNNEFSDRNLEIGERLAKRYFWFLVDEYGFEYDNYRFISEKMLIEIEVGHKTPRIYISKIGEPDFTRLNLEWILKFLHGISPSDSRDYTVHNLAENMAFISDIIHKDSRKLIDEFENWWIPAQIFMYRLMKKNYEDSGQKEVFLTEYKEYHDYLKSKGVI